MRIAINAMNLISAGTLAGGKELLEAISAFETGHYFLVTAPRGLGYERLDLGDDWEWRFFTRPKRLSSLWRIWFDFVFFPSMVQQHGLEAVIVLGSHAPARLAVPVLVLLQDSLDIDPGHPPLSSRHLKEGRLMRWLERRMFEQTIGQTDAFIVQTDYMKARLVEVWKVDPERIYTIPHALASELLAGREGRSNGGRKKRPESYDHKILWLYVSRYHPHKNHRFILQVAERLRERGVEDMLFLFTLDPAQAGVDPLLRDIRSRGLSDLIINLGELSADQLAVWYQWADGFFFPSCQESFGNPLLEAMGFGLPVCAVDLPYSRAICGESAAYYRKDSIEDAVEKLLLLKRYDAYRLELCRRARQRFCLFPAWSDIARQYIALIDGVTLSSMGS